MGIIKNIGEYLNYLKILLFLGIFTLAGCSNSRVDLSEKIGKRGTYDPAILTKADSAKDLPYRFFVENPSSEERAQLFRVSIPVAKADQRVGTDRIVVRAESGRNFLPTHAKPLQYWGSEKNGSGQQIIRIMQVQFIDTLSAGEKRYYIVGEANSPGEKIPFQQHPSTDQNFSLSNIVSTVSDVDGVEYKSSPGDKDEYGIDETPDISPFAMTLLRRRYHYNNNGKGIGRDFLAQNAYVTTYADAPIVKITHQVCNDYRGAHKVTNDDPNLKPLGDVTVNKSNIRLNNIEDAYVWLGKDKIKYVNKVKGSDYVEFEVFNNEYLRDLTCSVMKIFALVKDSSMSSNDKSRYAKMIKQMALEPTIPLADLKTWKRDTLASLYGGPWTGGGNYIAQDNAEAENMYNSWNGNAGTHGLFESFGDVKHSATTGTPRNQPMTMQLNKAIAGEHAKALNIIHSRAVYSYANRQTNWFRFNQDEELKNFNVFPYMWGPFHWDSTTQLGRKDFYKSTDPYAKYRPAKNDNHGFGPGYDAEHLSMDYPYEAYLVTGEADLLQTIDAFGEIIRGTILAPSTYGDIKHFRATKPTSQRIEGWAAHGLIQAFTATNDERFADTLVSRATMIRKFHATDPHTGQHASKAFSINGNYSGSPWKAYQHTFYMPWQIATIMLGYWAGYTYVGDPIFDQTLFADLMQSIFYAMEFNWTDPTRGYVENGLLYYVPTSVDNKFVTPRQAVAYSSPSGHAIDYIVNGGKVLKNSGTNAFLVSPLGLLQQMFSSSSKEYLVSQCLLSMIVDPADTRNKSNIGRNSKWFAAIPETFSPSQSACAAVKSLPAPWRS